MILVTLCSLAALALVILGAAALINPLGMSHFYGLPVEGDAGHGFVRATGSRDLIIGLVLGAAIGYRYWPLIEILLAAGILLSVGDFWIAYHAAGKRFHRAHALHAGGIVAFVLVLTMALFAFGR
jgi:Domain of unknown function (DUF4267)